MPYLDYSTDLRQVDYSNCRHDSKHICRNLDDGRVELKCNFCGATFREHPQKGPRKTQDLIVELAPYYKQGYSPGMIKSLFGYSLSRIKRIYQKFRKYGEQPICPCGKDARHSGPRRCCHERSV